MLHLDGGLREGYTEPSSRIMQIFLDFTPSSIKSEVYHFSKEIYFLGFLEKSFASVSHVY